MADKILKSITFPDLADRYVIPTDAEDFTYEGENLKEVLDNKANVDGYYQNMSVGDADQLNSTIRENDKVPYTFRTSGGSVDIGDREYVNGIVGGTVAWNRFLNMPDGTTTYAGITFTRSNQTHVEFSGTSTNNVDYVDVYSITNSAWLKEHFLVGHKYLLLADPCLYIVVNFPYTDTSARGENAEKSTIYAPTSTPSYLYVRAYAPRDATVNKSGDIGLFDLTQMFGSTIADYIYSLEQANRGAGVAWLRNHDFITNKHYDYDGGTLKSVSGLLSHDTTGFNQWDEEWEVGSISTVTGQNEVDNRIRSKNYTRIIPNTTYSGIAGSGAYINFFYYDENKSYLSYAGAVLNGTNTFVTPSNACYMRILMQSSYGLVYKNDICINIAWDNSRNGEYEPYVKHSYPLDSTVELRGTFQLDANGKLYCDGDVYLPDGTLNRRYGIVDLGTLNWSGTAPDFYAVAPAYKWSSSTNFICQKYVFQGHSSASPWYGTNKSIKYHYNGSSSPIYELYIRDEDYNTIASFKTAMNGVYLVYELAEPTTETATAYTSIQIVDDFGTEEYVFSDSAFPIPVGHDTDYPVNLKAKLEMAPDSPSGDGDYIVRQTNGTNAYVPLVIEDALPTIPSTAGTYKLVVTVADGSDPVLSWESEV